jgi:hypothetical protein
MSSSPREPGVIAGPGVVPLRVLRIRGNASVHLSVALAVDERERLNEAAGDAIRYQ